MSTTTPAAAATGTRTRTSTATATATATAISAPPASLEAKIVVLGAQGVGKTSLVHRYIRSAFVPAQTQSTVGASFLTKRVVDIDTGTTVRLQIWDTAGQERFRSISKLYYRGANAAVLCYDITDEASFNEMGRWLQELRANLSDDTILHIVGTKADIAAEHPAKRKVPYERSIAYVAENLHPSQLGGARPGEHPRPTTPPAERLLAGGSLVSPPAAPSPLPTPRLQRGSGLWAQDFAWTWTSCHEVSASTGDGIDEVFRLITRRLVEQRNQRLALEHAAPSPGLDARDGYFNSFGSGHSAASAANSNNNNNNLNNGGSFRLGYGDRRRSWLGLPTFGAIDAQAEATPGLQREWQDDIERITSTRSGRCC